MQTALRRSLLQPLGVADERSRRDAAILGGLSRRGPERAVREPLPMRSYVRNSEVVSFQSLLPRTAFDGVESRSWNSAKVAAFARRVLNWNYVIFATS